MPSRRVCQILIATGLLLAGISPRQANAAEPGLFTFINRGEVGTLDPNRMSWLQDIRLGYALWEGLYALDPQTLEPVPGVAERIDLSADKTVYTFHLRDSAKWSNGERVTSADFIFAWRRMLREPGDYTYLLHYIRGAKAYEQAFAADPSRADFSAVGIAAPDQRTLVVTLEHPVTFFPDICAFPVTFPLNEKSMEPFGRRDEKTGRISYDERFTRPPDLVGNGPFKLTRWEFKGLLRMEQNEHYWDRPHVRSQAIEQYSAENPMAGFLKYETGTVDWLAEITGDLASDLREQGRTDLKVFPGFGTYFYSINCNAKLPGGAENPMRDPRVRAALSRAINRQPIVKNITRLGEPAASHYIPPGIFPNYESPEAQGYDPRAAAKLLADAGYPGGRGFPGLTLLYNNEGHHGLVAQFVAKQWQRALGISVQLEGVEIKTFRERLHNKDYHIARASWIGDYNDPSTFTDKYLSSSLNNDSAWFNPRYDELCAAAAREPDAMARLKLLSRAEAILLDETPIIPIYHYVNAYLIRDGVSGIPLHPRNMINFKSVQGRH